MGGFASSTKKTMVEEAMSMEKKEEEIVKFVMPLFYTQEAITGEEFEAAGRAWKMIVNNHCSHFFELKAQHPEIEFKLVSEYFFDVLYNRMFDVNPSCRGLFHRSVNKQGSFLLRMISMLLGEASDPPKFRKTLTSMTDLHNKLGIKAVEYSIMGEVILYTIKKCIGPTEYTANVHFGWAKVYSMILDVIIPNVVHFEMTHKDQVERQLTKRNSNHIANAGAAVFTERQSSTLGPEHSVRPSAHSPAPEKSTSINATAEVTTTTATDAKAT